MVAFGYEPIENILCKLLNIVTFWNHSIVKSSPVEILNLDELGIDKYEFIELGKYKLPPSSIDGVSDNDFGPYNIPFNKSI